MATLGSVITVRLTAGTTHTAEVSSDGPESEPGSVWALLIPEPRRYVLARRDAGRATYTEVRSPQLTLPYGDNRHDPGSAAGT